MHDSIMQIGLEEFGNVEFAPPQKPILIFLLEPTKPANSLCKCGIPINICSWPKCSDGIDTDDEEMGSDITSDTCSCGIPITSCNYPYCKSGSAGE